MLSDDKKIGVQAILEQLEEIFIFWLGMLRGFKLERVQGCAYAGASVGKAT